MQTWVVDATVEETVDAVVAASTSRFSVLQQSGRTSAGRGDVARQDRPHWTVLRADPTGTVWLKHRKGMFAHDVIVSVYPTAEAGVVLQARSRSRMRFFDYRANRRILSTLTAMLEAYWSHHGVQARPSLGEHFLLP